MKRALLVMCLLCLAQCTDFTEDLEGPIDPLGDFRLGYAIVVAPKPLKLLISEEATPEELIAPLDAALTERFSRFEGNSYFHLGVSVDGYSLPPPVGPIKPYLALNVTVWNDATQTKLNEEAHRIQVAQFFEPRLGTSKEDLLVTLSEMAARSIEDWMREMHAQEDWFASTGGVLGAAPLAQPDPPLAGAVDVAPAAAPGADPEADVPLSTPLAEQAPPG